MANQKLRIRATRLEPELNKRVERATKEGGFANPSAFIRAAIQRELAGRESGVDASEERIAASLDRLAREIRRVNLGQQALFAFVDFAGKDFADLRCGTAEGCVRPGHHAREDSVRSFSQKRRRRDGRRLSSCDDGVAEAWRRKLTKETSFGLDRTVHVRVGRVKHAPGRLL